MSKRSKSLGTITGLVVAALVALSFLTEARAQPLHFDNTHRRYCIKGTSDNKEWSWRATRDPSGVTTEDLNAGPVPNGGSAEDLAIEFVASVNAQSGLLGTFLGGADVATDLGCHGFQAVFSIKNILNTEGFSLSVGPAGGPPTQCSPDSTSLSVGTGGYTNCNFNPVITGAGPAPVPGLDRRGAALLAALVLGAALLLIARRLRPARGSTV